MTKDIFSKVLGSDRRIWIFQYASTIRHKEVFFMSFIGMRKGEWTKVIPERSVSDLCE